MGVTWILFSELWWSSSLSFMIVLFTGASLTPQIYFLIGNLLVPIGLFAWMYAFTDLVWEDKQKLILIIVSIGGVFYEILFFYFLFTNPHIIGVMRGPIDAEYKSFVLFFLLFGLILFVITGLIFAHQSIKSGNPEFKLRAKFLIMAFISFFIGASLDGLKPIFFNANLLDYIYVINRIVLIFSAIAFFLGYYLPKWIKNRYLD